MTPAAKRRVLLTTFGSYGDLHPTLAVALELQRLGLEPIIGTIEPYRTKVEAIGLPFRPIRSSALLEPTRELMAKILDLRDGARFIIRKMMMPSLRTAYADTLAAAADCDLLVSHPLTFSTQAVAELTCKPWVSTHLAPLSVMSPLDPPVLPPAPWLDHLRPLGPRFFGPLIRLGKRSTRHWTRPYDLLRAELGLPRLEHPLFEGSYSPTLALALFSPLLGPPQTDWPPQVVATGFPFFDRDVELAPEMERFLAAGAPPLVFTLGTSAVVDAGRFYHQSADAAIKLGRRAILLTGLDPANRPPHLPPSVAAFDYAPFSTLFPRAAAIVHQGGVGTTAQAMRAGRPMLVMPYAVDQPDNAARVQRLGIARVVSRKAYSAERAARELNLLLSTPSYAERATQIGAQIRAESGAATAAELIAAQLTST
jgi:UDP:flavonoid glycosyltransferase YjiC (YdhE family)